MEKCYRFEKLYYSRGLLDNCVDATYIIHLEGNGRLSNIRKQLDTYTPTKSTYILYNRGYKECEKGLHENSPAVDLVDAYITIFNHAKTRAYKNVLILEDDFIFDEKIKNREICNSIGDFINVKTREEYIYLLGCLPMVQIPHYSDHRISLIKAGTHACIYSSAFQQKILETDQTTIGDWDVYTNMNTIQYMYYFPLCYQLFPETENQQRWFYVPIFTELFAFLRWNLQLDTRVEPGYVFFYHFFSYLYLLFFCIFIFSGKKLRNNM